MWCTPNGFCINGRRWFSETSWNIGALSWRWQWLRLRLGAELKISIAFSDLQVGCLYQQFWHCNHRVLHSLICVSSSLPFVYREVLLGLDCYLFFDGTNSHWKDRMVRLIKMLVNNIIKMLMIADRWPHIRLCSLPLVSPTYTNPQMLNCNP